MLGDKFYEGKSLTDFRDFPDREHYAILLTGTHSRDDGYGGHYNQPYVDYRIWLDRTEWEATIKAMIKVEVNVGID